MYIKSAKRVRMSRFMNMEFGRGDKSKILRPVSYEKFVVKLAKATGVTLTEKNVNGWLEGEEGYAKVDRAVKDWLGAKVFEEWFEAARLWDYVQWKLGVVVTTVEKEENA